MPDDHALILTTDELFALGEVAALGRLSELLQPRHKAPALAAMKKLLALMVEHAEEVENAET